MLTAGARHRTRKCASRGQSMHMHCPTQPIETPVGYCAWMQYACKYVVEDATGEKGTKKERV
jgi:hypothetical protein